MWMRRQGREWEGKDGNEKVRMWMRRQGGVTKRKGREWESKDV